MEKIKQIIKAYEDGILTSEECVQKIKNRIADIEEIEAIDYAFPESVDTTGLVKIQKNPDGISKRFLECSIDDIQSDFNEFGLN